MRKETKMYLTVEERTDWINVEGCGDVRFYPHPELDGIYVSREGLVAMTRVKSEKTYLLNQSKSKVGYIRVGFNIKDEETDEVKTINKLVHRLVLETFIPTPDEESDWVVDHIDNNKENNSLKNLQWLTRTKNLRKRDELGSLNKITYVYDRVTDTCTEYESRLVAAEAIGIFVSNMVTAMKYDPTIIKGRYYVTPCELTNEEVYYIFKEYDLKVSRRNANVVKQVRINKLAV